MFHMKHNECVTREIFYIYCYNLHMSENLKLEVGVKVLLVSPEKRVLFLKRNSAVYGAGLSLLDIPGGRIDVASSTMDNLMREVLEETGKKVDDDPEILSAQDIWFNGSHIVRLTYISRVTDEIVRLSNEHTSFEWIDVDELPLRLSDLDPYIAEAIKDKMSFIKNFVYGPLKIDGKA